MATKANATVKFLYEGNLFRVERERHYCDPYKLEIEVQTDVLALPNEVNGVNGVNGKELTSCELNIASGAELVRELRVPAALRGLYLDNGLLPNLKAVVVDPANKEYSGNGAMLCSKDGRELVYSLAEGLKETATVPAGIRLLSRTSFRGSRCKQIIFENPDVRVESESAFQDSAWLEAQTPLAIVGNMLFRLRAPVKRLEVPPGIRRIHEGCFSEYAPETLVAPFLPSRDLLRHRRSYGFYGSGETYADFTAQCHTMVLTSPSASISFELLRQWEGLCAIECPDNHRKYWTKDGVLFSRNRKTLLFYPVGRSDGYYRPPDTTVKIAPKAFQDHAYLREIDMPDSIRMIGMSAFYHCSALSKIHFSANLREIPDAGVYGFHGVFENCPLLTEITLPDQLRYIGSKAFLNSGVRTIHWGNHLEEIGEHAFCAILFRTVSLPPSLRRVRCGAFLYADDVTAYEGSARGLVSAINAAPVGETQALGNLLWHEARIHVLGKNGTERDVLVLPQTLKHTAAYHLELAWNDDTVNYEEYDACLDSIQDPEEKMDFAIAYLERNRTCEDDSYASYFRYNAWKIAERLIRGGEEELFLKFLRAGYLSSAARSKALKLCGELGQVTLSAYLLAHQEKESGGKKKRSRFVL